MIIMLGLTIIAFTTAAVFSGLMKRMYTLAKKHQPVSRCNIIDYIDLAKDLGVGYLDALHQGENAQHTSERTLHDVLDVLGSQVLASTPRGGKRFAIEADESTDVAVMKQLISYISYAKVRLNCFVSCI